MLNSKLRTIYACRANPNSPDPAIDVETDRMAAIEGFAKYIVGRDLEDIRVKPGEALTLFEIKRPTVLQLGVLHAIPAQFEKQRMAFKYCVHQVRRGDKVLLEVVHPDRAGKDTLYKTEAGQAGPLAPDDYVEEVAQLWGASTIAEMGQVALDFSELSEVSKTPFGFWGGSAAKL